MTDDIDYEVTIDDKNWYSVSPHSEYDAIHCVAGAILAGADEITIEKNGPEDVNRAGEE